MLVEKNFSLQPYNSFGIMARADALLRVRSVQDLHDWHGNPALARQPVFVLGGGSNIVLTGDLHSLTEGRKINLVESPFVYVR